MPQLFSAQCKNASNSLPLRVFLTVAFVHTNPALSDVLCYIIWYIRAKRVRNNMPHNNSTFNELNKYINMKNYEQ